MVDEQQKPTNEPDKGTVFALKITADAEVIKAADIKRERLAKENQDDSGDLDS